MERPTQTTRTQYASTSTSNPTSAARNRLCFNVNRISCDCCRTVIPVAAAATAIDCRLIIFPSTPPAEFDAAISTRLNPRCSASVTMG